MLAIAFSIGQHIFYTISYHCEREVTITRRFISVSYLHIKTMAITGAYSIY